MIIKQEDWAEASNGVVEDRHGELWRIIGFLDRPTVILDPVPVPGRVMPDRQYVVMGSAVSDDFFWLRRDKGAGRGGADALAYFQAGNREPEAG